MSSGKVLAERRKRSAIWLGLLCVLLGLLPVAGLLATKVSPWIALSAMIMPLAVLAVAKHMELGIAAMLLVGYLVRFSLPTGTSSRIVLGLVICVGCIGLWILDMLVKQKCLKIKATPVNVPLLAFMATVGISWVWGRAFRDPLVHELGHPLVSAAAGTVMVLLPGCVLLAANKITDLRWLEAFVWIVLLEGLVTLIIDLGVQFGVRPILSLHTFLSTNRVIQANSRGLLPMWCAAFAFSLALFDRKLHRAVRVMLLLYVAGWVYWGFFVRRTWLVGWVPVFAVAGIIALLRSKLLLAVVGTAIVIAGVFYWQTEFQQESRRSGVTRLAAYAVNWRVTSRHLLFGTGPAGYASYYMSYFPTEAMASHSNFIDLIAQTGIVGTMFILWFLGAQVWHGYRTRLALRGRGYFSEAMAVAILAGTGGCIVAMALGDWLLPFAYTQTIAGFDLASYNWLFMGCLWVLNPQLPSQTSSNERQKDEWVNDQ